MHTIFNFLKKYYILIVAAGYIQLSLSFNIITAFDNIITETFVHIFSLTIKLLIKESDL